jgi:hypothetical protein
MVVLGAARVARGGRGREPGGREGGRKGFAIEEAEGAERDFNFAMVMFAAARERVSCAF